ncbi:hypothetical protein IWQ60_000002 [Tieghemiomyces parasiticus]|uniref:Uncharacterized protein n=1 Tax=Tieghemiomyces parasiticus TaxID=78921 RepID=A0A9W8AMX5_9FUNG|nr:hypothetical protein IWQ60_000002 [Tieghemiomyces parasiticus]
MIGRLIASSRLAAQVPTTASLGARYMSRVSAPAMKDLAQDVYLKNLRNFKPSPQKAEVDQVKEFTPPKAPQSPKFDQDLAAELSAYDAEETPVASKA